MSESEHFNLAATTDAIGHAIVSIVCRIGFDAAIHGYCVALIVLVVGISLKGKGHRYGKPLVAVFRKIAIFCTVLMLPGLVCLLTQGKLPPVNTLQLNSVGLIVFWALVTLHLIMEEMNFQLFPEQASKS